MGWNVRGNYKGPYRGILSYLEVRGDGRNTRYLRFYLLPSAKFCTLILARSTTLQQFVLHHFCALRRRSRRSAGQTRVVFGPRIASVRVFSLQVLIFCTIEDCVPFSYS